MPYPWRRLQTSLSGSRRWIIAAGPVFAWIMEAAGAQWSIPVIIKTESLALTLL